MKDADSTIEALRECVRAFVHERDWEQFHTPKELSSAIAIEAAELMEPFLWKSAKEAEQALTEPETRAQITEELADVLILCFSMANQLGVDVCEVVSAKLETNTMKYPADLARGSARKYTAYKPAT